MQYHCLRSFTLYFILHFYKNIKISIKFSRYLLRFSSFSLNLKKKQIPEKSEFKSRMSIVILDVFNPIVQGKKEDDST